MVVDTSALVAILKAEPEAAAFLAKLATAAVCRLSAANFVEAGLIASRDPTGAHLEALEDLLREFDIRIEPVGERQARLALDAFRRYGKGTGHPAGLNYGDCFAYALAADTGEGLLFKGDDFPCTDLAPA
ncbi:ribonuclease [Azospirillum sp. TSH7]|uniref:type II toxin-antitoxin system VapC family toxin n=1 Tax=unclassified Azospirillum TaxID=2630922 RepID=UPI000D608F80|nr:MULTISPECIES: type II toxin-antitoxin system VapC family toxin [unclassified Azospirillum]PWC59522.1 ribonuclease [Azospirillum sp. TSH20]PWC67125.1 ribonuclease [Azospirillum sp. TSH7]